MSSKYTTYVRANWRPLVIALAMAIMTLVALLAIPSAKVRHTKPGPGSEVTPRELHARDFPVKNYAFSVVDNPIDPCSVVAAKTVGGALELPQLKATMAWRSKGPEPRVENTCVYGDRDFTVQVDTECPWTYAVFNNSARAFTGAGGYVNRIIAITPDELKVLKGVRYGVWLFHGNRPAGAVFRLNRVFVHGHGIGPNVTFYTQSPALTRTALTELIVEAAGSLK